MPRIRTLKPEHRQHRKVGPLDHVTYRLWVGMILEADDEGRLVYDPEALRVLIFGYHPKISRALVEASTNVLEDSGLVRLYRAETPNGPQTYAWFPSWRDHQRIDHATPSKLPPPNDSVIPREESERPREFSRGIGKDRKGSDRKGSEGKGKDVGRPPDVCSLTEDSLNGHGHSPKALTVAAIQILDFLNRKAGRQYQAVDTNLDLITALLRKGTTVDQIHGVIAKRCARWKGDPKMEEYLRPSTLFRASKFQDYLGELPASAFEAPPDA